MEQVKQTKQFIIKWTVLLNLALMFLLAIFWDLRSVAGILVGGIISVINFHLLTTSLQKAVQFQSTKAGIYTFVQYILRYLLWGSTLYIALQRPDVNLMTVIVGMLTVKAVILVVNVFNIWPNDPQRFRERRGNE
ncbi:ATP synthase subunit I [Halanaerobaculum tunisiense]